MMYNFQRKRVFFSRKCKTAFKMNENEGEIIQHADLSYN
jgi:hypothetical protein